MNGRILFMGRLTYNMPQLYVGGRNSSMGKGGAMVDPTLAPPEACYIDAVFNILTKGAFRFMSSRRQDNPSWTPTHVKGVRDGSLERYRLKWRPRGSPPPMPWYNHNLEGFHFRIHHCDPKRKQESTKWKHLGSPKPKRLIGTDPLGKLWPPSPRTVKA